MKTFSFISKSINNEELVGLFSDISKASDSIDRNLLIQKLENAGIRGPILELMKSYLKDRIQRIFVNNTISDSCKVLSVGVLQGSILASLLFLIYVDDFYKCTDALSIVYADDTSCLFKHKDMHILLKLLEKNLKTIFN